MNSLELIKKKIFNFDKLFFNSSGLKIYNFFKYNSKLILINNFKTNRKIRSKKRIIFKKNLIISLTSHQKRFKTLPLVLNSIVNQSFQADKIILWIEKKDKKKLPISVLNFRNIKIEYCENNLLSYTKIIPALKKFHRSYIITLDDDVIYRSNIVENLVSKSKKYPNDVIANRIHKIRILKDYPTNYNSWYFNFKKQTKYAFFTGNGGVIYPPQCFYKDVLKVKYFKKLAPLGDDIWLNWMVRLKGTNVRNSHLEKIYDSIKIIKGGLYKKNIKQNFNDTQINNMIRRYGFPF